MSGARDAHLCGQDFLDTQNSPIYTPADKMDVLIPFRVQDDPAKVRKMRHKTYSLVD